MVNMTCDFVAKGSDRPVEWRVTSGLVPYAAAVSAMEERVARIARGEAAELVWLVEHPPLYTAGTGAHEEDLVEPQRFPVHRTGRGGQYTYHGPGQRVAYLMLDLARRKQDVRAYVCAIEAWVINALDRFNIDGERREGRIGVWVRRPEKGPEAEDKIAAIGVRVRRWITFHGVSLNVEPDLGHYTGIIPCGIRAHGVTSLLDLGRPVTMDDADASLLDAFAAVFGSAHVTPGDPPELAMFTASA